MVDAGGQAALLAPTEVLAAAAPRRSPRLLGDLAGGGMLGGADHAHRRRAAHRLDDRRPKRARRCSTAATGEAGIVIGTHALLERRVQFADLGLVVVDEQHRFGVEQRAALSAKAARPRRTCW